MALLHVHSAPTLFCEQKRDEVLNTLLLAVPSLRKPLEKNHEPQGAHQLTSGSSVMTLCKSILQREKR